MKTNFIGKSLDVPADFKATAEKKLKKYEKFFKGDAGATLVLKKRKNGGEVVEITISSSGILYRAEKEHDTFQNAFDSCMNSLERQIVKNKTRLQNKLREGATLKNLPLLSELQENTEIPEQTEFKIREKTFSLSPMSAEEAILQMNMLGHNFFVFEDSTSGEVAVVYSRLDGNYGLLLPQKKM